MRTTQNGNLQLGSSYSQGASTGLQFGTQATLDTLGELKCASVITNQAVWLDNESNLTGTLAWRRPDGKAVLAISSIGNVRVRDNLYTGFGEL